MTNRTAPTRNLLSKMFNNNSEMIKAFEGLFQSGLSRLSWSDDDSTLNIELNNEVILQTGQESLIYAKNTGGTDILNGQLVAYNGAVGNSGRMEIQLGNGSMNKEYLLGIATEDISNNEFGFITFFGLVRGINTKSFNDGDPLYPDPSTSGALINTAPTSPNFHTPIAVVVKAHKNGSVFVRMKSGETVESLHDVNITNPSDGDVLVYNSSQSRWEAVNGDSGSFTSNDGKTITVTKGIITNIV